jgi:Polyketide cyclase / dehydrase and lipid transport
MSVQIQVSQVIDRSVDKVFSFFAREHVKNHPRWDPDIELWLDSDVALQVGTIIHRRNRRSGTPVEGTMEVVEFEPDRVFATVIHDGSMEIRGRTLFEATGEKQTKLTMIVELPGMDESMDTSFLTGRMERSIQKIKQLIESEVHG